MPPSNRFSASMGARDAAVHLSGGIVVNPSALLHSYERLKHGICKWIIQPRISIDETKQRSADRDLAVISRLCSIDQFHK